MHVGMSEHLLLELAADAQAWRSWFIMSLHTVLYLSAYQRWDGCYLYQHALFFNSSVFEYLALELRWFLQSHVSIAYSTFITFLTLLNFGFKAEASLL